MPNGLQLVIGTDGPNSFSVFKDEKSNTIKVYYGMNLYDSVVNDKTRFEYK